MSRYIATSILRLILHGTTNCFYSSALREQRMQKGSPKTFQRLQTTDLTRNLAPFWTDALYDCAPQRNHYAISELTAKCNQWQIYSSTFKMNIKLTEFNLNKNIETSQTFAQPQRGGDADFQLFWKFPTDVIICRLWTFKDEDKKQTGKAVRLCDRKIEVQWLFWEK